MKLIPKSLSRVAARQALLAKKNAPTLLFVAGVTGMIGSTVLACRATLNLQDVIDEFTGDLDVANTLESDAYSDEDRRKDKAIIYGRLIGHTAKLYAPSILLGTAAIGCLTKSHSILRERNLALTAAYAAVDEAFRTYRERVIAKYGEDQDREFRYTTETVDVINDRGKMHKEVRVGPGEPSMYARFFDQYCSEWSKEAEYNLALLTCKQSYWNDILRIRGHVFLNEVYISLGMTHTTAGSVVGWVLSNDGDNYIDFGVFEGDGASRAFVNGREGSILLDFNVDGVIFDKLGDGHDKEKLQWQS